LHLRKVQAAKEHNMEIDMLYDPAQFAEAIRTLARDAYRLRHSQSPATLWRLSRRIEVLASALGDRRGGSLGTFLDNLGREVRYAARDRAHESRALCVCA
jgi:hypothetical protein